MGCVSRAKVRLQGGVRTRDSSCTLFFFLIIMKNSVFTFYLGYGNTKTISSNESSPKDPASSAVSVLNKRSVYPALEKDSHLGDAQSFLRTSGTHQGNTRT